MDTIEDETLFYHRLVETFKFAYAQRSELGDPDFVNITEIEDQLKDPVFAEAIRQHILDEKTSNDLSFYNTKHSSKTNHGTSPLTLIAPNGDAVAVTSTINF